LKDRSEQLDKMEKALNRMIREEMKKIYSPQVINRFFHHWNMGVLENSDGFARYTGPCGDTMEIFLKIKAGRINLALFQTAGCFATVACGSMVCELARGKKISIARQINQNKILKALGGLPEENQHCALLAATALQKALSDYFAKRQEPWKKAYQV